MHSKGREEAFDKWHLESAYNANGGWTAIASGLVFDSAQQSLPRSHGAHSGVTEKARKRTNIVKRISKQAQASAKYCQSIYKYADPLIVAARSTFTTAANGRLYSLQVSGACREMRQAADVYMTWLLTWSSTEVPQSSVRSWTKSTAVGRCVSAARASFSIRFRSSASKPEHVRREGRKTLTLELMLASSDPY